MSDVSTTKEEAVRVLRRMAITMSPHDHHFAPDFAMERVLAKISDDVTAAASARKAAG